MISRTKSLSRVLVPRDKVADAFDRCGGRDSLVEVLPNTTAIGWLGERNSCRGESSGMLTSTVMAIPPFVTVESF